MPIIFPLVTFLLTSGIFASATRSYRTAFLYASLSYGVALTLITEVLSLVSLINIYSLTIFWGSLTCIEITYIYRNKLYKNLPVPISSFFSIYAAILAVLVPTLIIALVSPPNNWDSMTYHLGRIVHWIQNQSVAHYPTHIIRQIYFPPWAEFSIMHLQILSGSDYFANLVQWFSMVGCIVGTTLIAEQLGASRLLQGFTAVIVVTIPMGILQASSTQNDYVAAFWLVCFAYFGILLVQEMKSRHAAAVGVSLGLALLTKGTVYLFALPFIIWFFIAGCRTYGRMITKPLLVIVTFAVALNLGHYTRNLILWGNPLGGDNDKVMNERIGLRETTSNLARNIANNTWTHSRHMNVAQYNAVHSLHLLLNIDPSDPDTSLHSEIFKPRMLTYNEDFTGNGLHMLLILITAPFMLFRPVSRMKRFYCLAVMAGLLLFCMLLKWQPWGVRLLLPFFVLASPAVAVSMPFASRKWITGSIMAILLIGATPWILKNELRPLTGEWTILNTDREHLYFTSNPTVAQYYFELAGIIAYRVSCQEIGIIGKPDAYEYPLWMLIRSRVKQFPRIEHIDVDNVSGSIPLKDFNPCMKVQIIEPI